MSRKEPLPSLPDGRSLTESLVRWYRAHARQMAWRDDPSPYHVLLSELMLQQTRVQTVREYFDRFVARWPTLSDLAAASEDEVLTAWAGLGYYSRARNLHRAARSAVARGGLPSDPVALQELPGIGPYTAGAIASIAFGVAAPVVDGNVERVLSRVDGRREDPRSAAGRRALWSRAAELVALAPPAEVNQGLMELGATVCTPRSPRCGECPWRSSCRALASDEIESLPRLRKKSKPTPVRGVAGLLWLDGGLLLGRRPEKGLLAGLWEPVGCELSEDETPEAGVRRAFHERAGLRIARSRPLGEVIHVFTHRRLTLTVLAVEVAPGPTPRLGQGYQDLRVVDPDLPGEVALSRLATKTLALAPRPDRHLGLLAAEWTQDGEP